MLEPLQTLVVEKNSRRDAEGSGPCYFRRSDNHQRENSPEKFVTLTAGPCLRKYEQATVAC